MAGDPTQAQSHKRRPESPAFQEWYIVTGGGSALRMTPGLTVGESDSGALALNDPAAGNQWVELVVADNGEPWATIVTRDKSLRVEGTTCLRHPLQIGATIRLPNNTLHISRDLGMPRLSGTVVEVVHRDIPERPQVLVEPAWEEALAAVREPRPGTPAAEIPEPHDPAQQAPLEAWVPPEANQGEPDGWSDGTLTMAERRRHAQRPRSAGRRRPVTVMAGVLALGAVTLAGVVAVLVSMGEAETARLGKFDPARVDIPPVSLPADPPAPAEVSARASPGVADPVADAVADAVADPVLTQPRIGDGRSAADAPPSAPSAPRPSVAAAPEDAVADEEQVPPSDRTAAADREPEQVVMLPRAEPEPAARVEPPPVERRPIPPESQADAQITAAPEPVAGPEASDRKPDPTLVAELEAIALTAQAVAAELALRRDLRAADLAFAQGKLTSPPEENAYALYSRVLALDPESPEARSGLQSVRDGLINRALAQLAGGELDDARRSLEDAAGAGVNPLLIADLRGEVDQRQRLIEADTP